MNTRLIWVASLLVSLAAVDADAQTEVGMMPVALVSFQAIDDAYVGSPYLSEGLGGLAPGFGVGFNVIAPNHFVFGVEYASASFEKVQYGRLVRGGFPLEGIPATTRLRDSLVSFLAGYATTGSLRVIVVGGLSARLDRTTIDDQEQEKYDFDEEGSLPPLTGGIDVLRSLASRTDLLLSARYTFNERHTRLQYLGIGPHILRAGIGVRIRVN